MKHLNIAKCGKCDAIISKHAVHPDLLAFYYSFRDANPDAHISAAGRGEAEQNDYFDRKLTKARFLQSKHNFEPVCAIDWFRITQSGGASFDLPWFRDVLNPAVKQYKGLVSGGDWPKFRDWPHVEVENKVFNTLKSAGALTPIKN